MNSQYINSLPIAFGLQVSRVGSTAFLSNSKIVLSLNNHLKDNIHNNISLEMSLSMEGYLSSFYYSPL